MGVEPTLTANQLRSGSRIGVDARQETEQRSMGVCQSRCV